VLEGQIVKFTSRIIKPIRPVYYRRIKNYNAEKEKPAS